MHQVSGDCVFENFGPCFSSQTGGGGSKEMCFQMLRRRWKLRVQVEGELGQRGEPSWGRIPFAIEITGACSYWYVDEENKRENHLAAPQMLHSGDAEERCLERSKHLESKVETGKNLPHEQPRAWPLPGKLKA